MFGSQFDGAAAFSGGGFMPSQTVQAADSSVFSPAKNRDAQSLLPLTVKQISNAVLSSDDRVNLLIDGVDVNNVTLLGKVLNKAERVTDVTFSIDDGTGRIDCNKWINEQLDTNEAEGILDGMYVRVNGHLKSFQGKRQLNVFSIRPVTDFNEITTHFIECMYVHMYNTKHQKSQGGLNMHSYMTNPLISNSSKVQHAAPSNQYSAQPVIDGLSHNIKMVLDFLQRPEYLKTVKGPHVNDVALQLGLQVDKVKEAIHCLEEEGLVYSTIDENHFKSTKNA
ncbi:hypothetical protein SAY86_027737 [Trapa natans]|uniref:Uncharacterized protein n=1 Tax=Trapa natans TaxID=22666 RepID=A0AAN7KMV5_TRANT|nr:hypothetical protein SAY86_027737 [Trapa natans]